MLTWFRQLDELLRGRRTEPGLLGAAASSLPIVPFLCLAILLGATYGFFMGWFGAFNRTPPAYMQLVSSSVKLPALFVLTLLVTLPSLYVFSALVGSGLTFIGTVRLLVSAVVVNVAVAASFGTILGFFTLSTTSYPFMVLLNVLLLAIAGLVGLGFLLRTLRRLAAWQGRAAAPRASESTAPTAAEPTEASVPRPASTVFPAEKADGSLDSANSIFRVWVIIYALVGAQMGWLLRPFIGSPKMPFEWFRPRSGNFFEAVAGSLRALFNLNN